MSIHAECAQIVLEIEAQLRVAGLWEKQDPDAQALQSTEPFCIDTLRFSQWLQFVFIRRLVVLIESGADLPSSCAITPMAEESFRGMGLTNESVLLGAIERMDAFLTR